jgi:bacterioferritin
MWSRWGDGMKLGEIIEALNDNLSKEYGAVLLYIDIRRQSTMSGNKKVTNLISDLAQDEMSHAEMLADKIAEMGGTSTWQIKPFERRRTVKESLELVVESEKKAIRDYSELIKKLDRQPILQDTLRVILEDEKRHKERTENLLRMNPRLFGHV